jgi:hypothetical protein
VSRGPEIVPATGSFNPIREMKPPTEKVMRPVPGWTRKLVTGENYGLQFSFMLNTRS